MRSYDPIIIGLVLTLGGAAHATDFGDGYSEGRVVARAISDAFANGKAKQFRLETTSQLDELQYMEQDELAGALTAYVDTAIERGVQGLEGAISASVAALARRDVEGWGLAHAALARLGGELRVATSVARRPNAHVPIALPGSPVVGYLPLPIARRLVVSQARTGTVDIQQGLAEALCNEAALGQLAAELGPAAAAAVAALCGEHGHSGGTYGGDLGLGFASDLSVIDCLMEHHQTRAEQVAGLMQACAESMAELGQGNPFADGGIWQPLQEQPRTDQRSRVGGSSSGAYEVTYFDWANRRVRSDKIDGSVYSETHVPEPDLQNESWTKGYDSDTRVTFYEVTDGVETERVEIRPDNSYVVTRKKGDTETYRQEYDAKGNPVGQASGSSSMDFGETPECRAATVAIMRDNVAGDAIDAGALDPRVVNPHPDAAPVEGGDLACLGIAGGPQLDQSFACNAAIAMCPEGYVRDQACNCQRTRSGAEPSQQCGQFVLCARDAATHEGGVCGCPDGEPVFVDEGVRPGGPVDPWVGAARSETHVER